MQEDYCTSWPDRMFGHDWSMCCLKHDLAYMAGTDKLVADFDLATCVSQVAPLMGPVMFGGVLLFGYGYWKRAQKRN